MRDAIQTGGGVQGGDQRKGGYGMGGPDKMVDTALRSPSYLATVLLESKMTPFVHLTILLRQKANGPVHPPLGVKRSSRS
jgi:hypothetical protein